MLYLSILCSHNSTFIRHLSFIRQVLASLVYFLQDIFLKLTLSLPKKLTAAMIVGFEDPIKWTLDHPGKHKKHFSGHISGRPIKLNFLSLRN